jgi:hypothetical protein
MQAVERTDDAARDLIVRGGVKRVERNLLLKLMLRVTESFCFLVRVVRML